MKPWFFFLSFSTWEAILGKEIPYRSYLQTWKYVFSMERYYSKRRNNCALASFSLELISWLKNTTTEKCKWLFLRVFKKYVLLKYILLSALALQLLKNEYSAQQAPEWFHMSPEKVTHTGHLRPFDWLMPSGSAARISVLPCTAVMMEAMMLKFRDKHKSFGVLASLHPLLCSFKR